MAFLKCKMGFTTISGGRAYPWTESHYLRGTGSVINGDSIARMNALCYLRSQLLGPGITIGNPVLSVDTNVPGTLTRPSRQTAVGTAPEGEDDTGLIFYNPLMSDALWAGGIDAALPDFPFAVLECRKVCSNTNRGSLFLSGLPDVIQQVTSRGFSGPPRSVTVIQDAFNAYRVELTTSWGMRAINKGVGNPFVPVIAVTSAPIFAGSNTIVFTFTTAGAHNILPQDGPILLRPGFLRRVLGQRVSTRGYYPSGYVHVQLMYTGDVPPVLIPNQFQVIYTPPLTEPLGVYQIGTMKIRRNVFTILPYTSIIPMNMSTRKRASVAGGSRGRGAASRRR